MATYRTSSTVFLVIKEAEFNKGGTFTETDTVSSTADSSLKAEVKSIERKIRTNSFIGCPTVAGTETASGSLGLEIIPATGNELVGDVVYEVALGQKVVNGAKIDYWKETGSDFAFAADGNKITTTNTSLEYIKSGDTIVISGSEKNDGTYTVTDYVNEHEIHTEEALTDEDAGNTVTCEDTTCDRIYPMDSGDANYFKLSKPCGDEYSLSVKKIVGCDNTDSQTLYVTGIVPSSIKLNFPTGDVCSATFDLGGAGFTTNTGDDVPAVKCLDTTPYVGKLAKFSVDKKTYESKNLELTISNTITDLETITSTGISAKITTKKEIKGSISVLFEDYSELDRMKKNEDAMVYLRLEADGAKFAIYLPRVRYSSVDISDDGGILMNKIEFIGYVNDKITGEAFLLAHKGLN